MTRILVVAAVSISFLAGCATSKQTKYSVTPDVKVTVKGGQKKKAAKVNYQVSPESSKLTGSGGSAK